MQPYQEAGNVTRNSGEGAISALKYAGAAAVGTAGSMAARSIISRVIPLLSEYVPQSFAKKGLSKIDPRFGKFIDKAEDEGYDFNEIKDFLGDKIEKSSPAKEGRNLIQQVSPELHEFIDQEIRKGRKPIEVGAIAQNDKRFSETIKKLEKQHKTPWSQILQSIYGLGDQALPEQAQAPQQAQQPQGQGLDPAVAQILQQGQALLQKFSGGQP